MVIRDASYWEMYQVKPHTVVGRKKKGIDHKKSQREKVRLYNKRMEDVAMRYARDMAVNPSELEKRMAEFLYVHKILFEFQKVFYIKNRIGKIIQFFIADFYIPEKRIIIETDGKFHEAQTEYDDWRTECIKKQNRHIEIIRWKWHDFDSPNKMRELLLKVGRNLVI